MNNLLLPATLGGGSTVMTCILALDQGTTSSRAIVFDEDGRIIASCSKKFTQHFPRPGWVEHDPEEIWRSQVEAAQAALAAAGEGRRIAAIGIANQRETAIVWDRASGVPLTKAIVWQDRRTADICERLRERGLESLIRERTGLCLDPYFTATKLQWILANVAGARSKAEAGALCAGTVDSWLAWKLSGGQLHITDVSNAARTLLFNIRQRCWDQELLGLFEIPAVMLPEVRSTSEIYGVTACADLPVGVPISALVGDQQAALFGQRCFRPGSVKNTYGTGAFLVLNTGACAVRSASGLLSTVGWRRGSEFVYALEGSVFIAGAVVEWLGDQLGVVARPGDAEAMARSVADNGGVYFVPAFAGLGAPHWDARARGAIVGLTRGASKAHIVRAALESIAYQTADVLEVLQRESGAALNELRVDGGASANDFLMQFQADLLGVPVVRPANIETTAWGAAMLAGLAVNVWGDSDLNRAAQAEERRFEPAMNRAHAAELCARWRKAVECAKGWE